MNVFIENPILIWVSIGLFLLIIEMLSGTYFFLWLAGAAFLTALPTWMATITFSSQCLVFSISCMAAIFLWQKYQLKGHKTLVDNGLNNRLAHYIGQECILDKPIIQGTGRIRLDDSQWTVNSFADSLNLPIGTRVKIVAVKGMVLQIEKVDE